MKHIITLLAACALFAMSGCGSGTKSAVVGAALTDEIIRVLGEENPEQQERIDKGVRQIASLWREEDGTADEFKTFCYDSYIADPAQREAIFLKISNYMESVYGLYNEMSLRLQWDVTIDNGPIYPVDERFAAFSPESHLTDDLYANKMAFYIALNFPHLTLAEKEALGDDRLQWAYARMGDMFTERIPADVKQHAATVAADAESYIAAYNIYMGSLLSAEGTSIFPEDMVLLSHWNLRDEIKANYNKGIEGLAKQRTVYEVMKRIISQEIPVEAINSGEYTWNPFTNKIYKGATEIAGTPETDVRYQKMLDNFHAMQRVDKYTGDTFIDRKFNDEMEVSVDAAEKLFDEFLSAPELQQIGVMIADRLDRALEPYDIWYDGFKSRSSLNEADLDTRIEAMYPDAAAFKNDLPNILVKLGFASDKAKYIADKVAVDPARGSGHAWGAAYKGQQSHLRTRIPAGGMDYKGYNIAIHEFGHNVEQTLSLYDVDYYMLSGVPNTAFTEALAFLFQKRDLDILGIVNTDPDKEAMSVLDRVWGLYEICGVSMLDIATWKWLYANPTATAPQLKEAVIRLSKEIWNKYYAPVFGGTDETVLAIYSHMISYPLYLSAYAFGHIIEFQVEQYLSGKDFAGEVCRIYTLGRLTPEAWMLRATDSPLSPEPILQAVREIL